MNTGCKTITGQPVDEFFWKDNQSVPEGNNVVCNAPPTETPPILRPECAEELNQRLESVRRTENFEWRSQFKRWAELHPDASPLSIERYHGLVVGVAKTAPNGEIKPMSRCHGEAVSLEYEVMTLSGETINDIATARIVARNLAPVDKSVAIIKEYEDNEVRFHVYTLNKDIETIEYQVGGLSFSNVIVAGKEVEQISDVEIVELYATNPVTLEKTPLVKGIVDNTPPPFPTTTETSFCDPKGYELNRRDFPPIGTAKAIVYFIPPKNKKDWSEHPDLAERFNGIEVIDPDNYSHNDETYGLYPNADRFDEVDKYNLNMIADSADTPNKIARLDKTTLLTLNAERRANLAKVILTSDEESSTKCLCILALLQSIPFGKEGIDSKEEFMKVYQGLKNAGLEEDLWSNCREDKEEEAMLLTLDALGAPDNLFGGYCQKTATSNSACINRGGSSDANLGIAESMAGMVTGLRDIDLGEILEIAGKMGQCKIAPEYVNINGAGPFVDNLDLQKEFCDNMFQGLLDFVTFRKLWDGSTQEWQTAERLGLKQSLTARRVGRAFPDALMTVAWGIGKIGKLGKLAKDIKQIGALPRIARVLAPALKELEGYGLMAKRWLVMTTPILPR